MGRERQQAVLESIPLHVGPGENQPCHRVFGNMDFVQPGGRRVVDGSERDSQRHTRRHPTGVREREGDMTLAMLIESGGKPQVPRGLRRNVIQLQPGDELWVGSGCRQ